MKLRLNKADLSCFKKQSSSNSAGRWGLQESPTVSEDLFHSPTAETFDIVRNSDFMVSFPKNDLNFFFNRHFQ